MSAKGIFMLTVFAVVCHNPCVNVKLPSYVKACRKNDPELNKCAVKHGREAIPFLIKGDPKFNIPPLDPMKVTEVKVEQGTGQIGLVMTFKDMSVYGMKDVRIDDIIVDFKNKRLDFFYSFDRIELIGKYEVSGKILVLPISGNGDCNITMLDNSMNITMKYDLVKKKDNLEYMNVTDFKMDWNFNGARYHLSNLFNGDKFLGDNMNLFLNENWKEVSDEVSPSIFEEIKPILLSITTGIRDKVPFNELFLDD